MEIFISIIKWLFSANSAGILTISAAVSAYIIYRLQVKSREKEAIIVLLNEIDHAESSLKAIISNNNFDVQNETISILPTCSWDRNYQIFTRRLSRDDFKLLSDFFNGCKAAQVELEQWRRYFVVAREEKGKVIQVELVKMALESTNDEDYKQKKNKMIKIANAEDYLFTFVKPENYFNKYIRSIPKISGTTALASLNKLSQRK